MGDVRRAVAQAMRYAGCLNRRSLGVSDVFPLPQQAVLARSLPPWCQAHDFRRSARGATHLVKPFMPFAAVGDPPVEDQRPKDGAQNLSTIHPLRTGRQTG